MKYEIRYDGSVNMPNCTHFKTTHHSVYAWTINLLYFHDISRLGFLFFYNA